MKAEFLKLAGVKSEKAFYKKYPTEAAFFKAHPEAKKSIKKAQYGTVMSGLSDYLQSMNNTAATPYPGTMFKQPGIPMANYQQAPNYDQMYMSMSTPDEQLKSYGVDNGVSTINASTLADDKSGYVSPGGPNTKMDKLNNLGNQLDAYAPYVGQLIGGYQNLRAGRRARKEAEKWAKVTDVQARASETEDVDDLRQYADNARKRRNAFMPEMTGEEFFPVYGVGTNVLARNGARLQDGGMVGGNPTEIQNTYEGGTDIYTDLEYEPLYNVDQIKSYRMGGYLPKAYGGAEMFSPTNMMSPMGGVTPWGAIGGIGSSIAGNLTGNDGGGQIGGAIGGAAGMALGGPMGAAIGQTLGTAVGGLVDTNDRDQRKAEAKIKANTNRMVASQYRESLQQGPFGSYMKNGGYMNPEYNPQVITMFGDVNEQDFADYAHKDEFRAGGHLKAYREPSERAMQTYDMGGELKTHWGGYAEPMSENPYLPGTGETVMFRGKSHEEYSPNGETGIGITYGDNPVEVERGEPAVKLKDGSSGEESLVVYGNLKISKDAAKFIGDEKAEGMKYKNYIADKSKFETKQNKLIQKSTEELGNFDPKDAYDKLKVAGLEAKILGGKMNLKEVAKIKEKSAFSQNTINETAEEYGLIADDLAKGKVKQDKEAMKAQAKYGATIDKFQGGGKKLKSVSAMKEVPKGQKRNEQTGLYGNVTPEMFEKMKEKNSWYDWENFDPSDEKDVYDFQGKFNKLAGAFGEKGIQYDGDFGEQTASADSSWFKSRERGKALTAPTVKSTSTTDNNDDDATFETVPYQRSKLLDIFGEILPYIRPTDQEALNARQLMGETYAMSTNQLEPVQATPYTPQLRVPYDISRQAAKNDLIAQTRAAQRMAQGNPEMQAAIAAQAYNPMQQLNEQDFIDNQRMRDAVYSGNIATLNDAELKNLAIYDQQYTRQEQAKSNTKATAQAALNSISDKYAKNALENRTLGVYENLYNYRYDKSGRAINMNAPFQPNIPYIYGADGIATHKIVYDKSGKNITGYQPLSKEEAAKVPQQSKTKSIDSKEDVSENEYSPISEDDIMYQERNGGKTKKKKYSQSSIVRAFK
jgi:hypothetical protein